MSDIEALLPVTVTKIVYAVLLVRLLYAVIVPEHHLNIADGDRHKDALVKEGDLGKLSMSLLPLSVAVYFALCLAFLPEHAIRQPWTLSDIAAALLCTSGLVLRRWSQLELGRMFTYVVGIRKGHRLVVTGPYKVLRHPSYTGLMLASVGLAWFVRFHPGLWLWLLQMVVASAMLAKRVQNEEAILGGEFGEEWTQQCSHTWKLVPFLF